MASSALAVPRDTLEWREEMKQRGYPGSDCAMLEAELLHVRSLIDFLLREPQRDDDASASDFVATWKLLARTPKACSAAIKSANTPADDRRLLQELDRMNKHLSHLTWERVFNPPPGVDFHEFAIEIAESTLSVFSRFADEVAVGSPDLGRALAEAYRTGLQALRG